MKIFMTGATGFIGAVLRDRLVEKGYTVHAIYRPSSNKDMDLDRPGVCYFEGDLLDTASLKRAMEGCDQVYHLAGYARVWAKDPSTFYNVNVLGTRNILKQAKKSGVSKVVLTSTGATIYSSNGTEPANENDRKKKFNTEYARTKFLAEEEGRKFNRKGLPTVIVNPPRVYGPGLLSESNAATKIIKWYLEGKWRFKPGDGSYIGNYAFVDDVVVGHYKAMQEGKPGEQYIIGGENLSFNELFSLISDITGRNHKLWPVPVPLIQSFARLEKWKADTLKLKPLITPAWVENYMKNSALSSKKAISDLNYSITPADKAIAITVHWLKNNNRKQNGNKKGRKSRQSKIDAYS